MEEINKYKEALQLAGKLALACQLVLNTDIKYLGRAIVELDEALNEYNNYILNWREK